MLAFITCIWSQLGKLLISSSISRRFQYKEGMTMVNERGEALSWSISPFALRSIDRIALHHYCTKSLEVRSGCNLASAGSSRYLGGCQSQELRPVTSQSVSQYATSARCSPTVRCQMSFVRGLSAGQM